MTEIKLPPLPEPFTYTHPGKSEGALFHAGHMQAYALAAVEADRQARGNAYASAISGEQVGQQIMIAFGKYVAGYRPGDENWNEEDQQVYDVVMGCPPQPSLKGVCKNHPQQTPAKDIPEGFEDALAQEIRRVDGNHSLGACALAEALIPFLSRTMLEETLKAGQDA